MTQQCEPTEGAEDGSVHWLIRPGDGALFSWLWEDGYWEYFGGTDRGSPGELFGRGWRYSHPASPTFDVELATTLSEISRLRTTIEAQSVTLQDSSAALAMVTKERDAALAIAGKWARETMALCRILDWAKPRLKTAAMRDELSAHVAALNASAGMGDAT